MGCQGREDSHCHGGTETGGVWDEWGRQTDHWQTLHPHIRTQINREEWRGNKADLASQGYNSGK